MVLKMASIWKHPSTGVYYLRQRPPADLVEHVRGKKVTLPIGSIAQTITVRDIVQISLKTKEPHLARERHKAAEATLWEFWRNQRAELASPQATSPQDLQPPSMSWRVAVDRFEPLTGPILTDLGVADVEANRALIVAETARLMNAVAAQLPPALGHAFVGSHGEAISEAESRQPSSPRGDTTLSHHMRNSD